MNYVPAIDGLRLLAILLVMAFHARVPAVTGGFIGVDLFFVLSGYLITSILLGEQQRRGGIDYRAFAKRRARRLMPALLLLLVVYLAVAPLLWPQGSHWRDAAIAAFYLSDYAFAGWGYPDILRHTWSLAVEVHFYLVIPLVIAALRGRNPVGWLLALYLGLTAWRLLCWETGAPWSSAYARFDTHATGLVMGCLVATVQPDRSHAKWLWVGVAGLLYFAWRLHWNATPFMTWAMPLVEVSSALCVLAAAQHEGILANRVFVYLGQLSYGAYLWHYPVARLARDHISWQGTLLLSVALGFALAALSWHFLEDRFRQPRTAAAG